MRTLVRYNRDLRIDLFRGIALWCIFIDHLVNGSLNAITFRQFGFCDSAELFVLLSGISAGMVYGGTAIRKGIGVARTKVLSRAAVLYRTHLLMMVIYLAEAALLMVWLRPPGFLQFYGLDTFAEHPYLNFLKGAALRFQPEDLDILPLYIVLLMLFCAVLPYMLRWPRTVLASSFALYASVWLFHLNLPGWPGFFNPFAWQLVFVLGAVSNAVLGNKRYWRGWDFLAASFAVFSLIASHAHFLRKFVTIPAWFPLYPDKSNLHPLRLLAIVALAWLAWRLIPATAVWLRSRWASPVILMGQHSLPVFVVSVFLSMAGEAWFTKHQDRVSEIVIQGAGSLLLLGLAAWCGREGRNARAASMVVPQPEAAPGSAS
jgi:hypothetical protein